MDVNKGLNRRMPPVDNDNVEQLEDIDKENILTISLTNDGGVLVNDLSVNSDEALRKQIRHFIIERGKLHVIELHIDRAAKYDKYFHLQNLIAISYNEIRDAASKKKYDTPFSQCSDEQKEIIQKLYPQRITERYD